MTDLLTVPEVAERLRVRLRPLRWRLARRIAPVPVIPRPGTEKGLYLVYLDGGFQWSIQARTFRLDMETTLPALDDVEPLPMYRHTGSYGTFSGTVGDEV